MSSETRIFSGLAKLAGALFAFLVLAGASVLFGAPARTGVGPDTGEPPDDLVCEQGAEPGAESVDPSRWAGRFGGIGIQIGFNGDAVTVEETMKDGPAEKAGMLKGDLITRINDESAAGLNVNDVVRRLRGEPGSALKLTVARPATGKTHECRLQRGLVKVESVRDAQLVGGKVGYARLTSFNRHTGGDLRAALAPLERAGARAWVLDLRHNRGGLLRAVRDVASQFLEPAQSALILRPAQAEAQQQFFASRYGQRLGGPLCVLVNLNTAGAAEALAGVLRWHRHALLIGAKTCGHSDVVRVVAAPNGTASLALHGDIVSMDEKKFGGGEGLAPDIELPAGLGEDTAALLRVLPGRREAADLANDRTVQRAVTVCVEQLERRNQ
ncbi:MAG: PDZ domain-containing protein [Verrucomicrobia bacterium]|nr:PDZ domain-containing protein [Verrucomicrobiota bacterium]